MTCVQLKNEANVLFQQQKYESALNLYRFSLENPDNTLDENLIMILNGNISQTYLSMSTPNKHYSQ